MTYQRERDRLVIHWLMSREKVVRERFKERKKESEADYSSRQCSVERERERERKAERFEGERKERGRESWELNIIYFCLWEREVSSSR